MPLSDGMRAQRFPFVTLTLVAANVVVWVCYELPHLEASTAHSSLYPCDLSGDCHAPLPWFVSWFTSMFMHGSWGHLIGNMWFLALFGKNVESAFGHRRYQLAEAHFGTTGGTAVFAHIGGFVLGVVAAGILIRSGSRDDRPAGDRRSPYGGRTVAGHGW